MTKELKKMNKLQRDVFMLLPIGMDRLISTTDIESILKIDKRYVMGIIEGLILEYNIPIGSLRDKNNYGYFIATNVSEKLRGTLSLERQAMVMDKRVKKVRAADAEIVYQYRGLYKNNEPEYDKQIDLLDYIEEEIEGTV